MNWIEAKVIFEADQPGLLAEAIAQVFHDLGFKGVVIDDPGLPPGVDWCDRPALRPQKPAVTGYFSEKEEASRLRQALEQRLEALAAGLGFFYQVQYRTVAESNWAEAWKVFFRPTPVGRHLVVKPSWYEFKPGPDQLVVEIDPGMAFGTGTHPSTCLSMVLLEKHLRAGDSLLDVGTGSGILMVTAARLGAGMVWGTDSDPLAVEVAGKNLLLNRIDPRMFKIVKTDLVEGVARRFKIVVANILAPVILRLIPALDRVLAPDGLFVCSGLITSQVPEIERALEEKALVVADRVRDKEWAALAVRPQTPA